MNNHDIIEELCNQLAKAELDVRSLKDVLEKLAISGNPYDCIYCENDKEYGHIDDCIIGKALSSTKDYAKKELEEVDLILELIADIQLHSDEVKPYMQKQQAYEAKKKILEEIIK